MPLAVSATTLSGRRRRRVDERADVVGVLVEQVAVLERPIGPCAGDRRIVQQLLGRSPGSRPARCRGRSGRAPARHSLIPLYAAGLCEAVNMAPGASRRPEAKYRMSVEASPRSVTDAPSQRAPSAKAADSSTPERRMSRATRSRSRPGEAGEGAARWPGTASASSWSGTVAADVVGLEDGCGSCRRRSAWGISLIRSVEGDGAAADPPAARTSTYRVRPAIRLPGSGPAVSGPPDRAAPDTARPASPTTRRTIPRRVEDEHRQVGRLVGARSAVGQRDVWLVGTTTIRLGVDPPGPSPPWPASWGSTRP